MVPVLLQEKLKERVEHAIKDLLLKGFDGAQKAVQVFEQHLPNKGKSVSRTPESTFYPCVVIHLQKGEISSSVDPQLVRVLFVVGVYDDEDSNQGYRDAMTIINRISENFLRHQYVDNKYMLQFPFEWEYSDEENQPYFFAWLDTYWEVPVAIQEDVEDLI